MRYLVTGHTGFKGAWLVMLLKSQGHEVSGLSLDPIEGSLFQNTGIASLLENDFRVDIRDVKATRAAIASNAPDVVFHLAAQPLVRESYLEPRVTFETNVIGTLNVVEAVSLTPSVNALVVVTTDKVYRNLNRVAGYREDEPLGGDDPYSSSKAMADILAQSWIKSFPGVPTAIARAGNVIGGGDVSEGRLLVDLMANLPSGVVTKIRYPQAVRPWQHVLDCLNGYLLLSEALLAGRGLGEWNFGPGAEGFVSVAEMADAAQVLLGITGGWVADPSAHLHEAELLALDSSKARLGLSWENALPFPESLQWTVEWHSRVSSGESPRDVSFDQISKFGNHR